MIRSEISSTIRKVFDAMYKDQDELIPRKQWVTAQVLVAAINCDLAFQGGNIQSSHFNRMVGDRSCGFLSCELFDKSNEEGLYRAIYDHKYCYYVTDKEGTDENGERLAQPKTNKKWFDAVAENSSTVIESIKGTFRSV